MSLAHAAEPRDPFLGLKAGAAAAEVRAVGKNELCAAIYSNVNSRLESHRRKRVQLELFGLLTDRKVKLSDAECLSLYWRARLITILLDETFKGPALQRELAAIDRAHLTRPWDTLLTSLSGLAGQDTANSATAGKGSRLADQRRLVADAMEAELMAEMQATVPPPVASSSPRPRPIRVRNDLRNPDRNASSVSATDCLDAVLVESLERAIEKSIGRALTADERKSVVSEYCKGRSIVEIARDLLSSELAAPLGRKLRPAEQQFAWNRWEKQLGRLYWSESAPEPPSSETRAIWLEHLVAELKK
jgi:hypothetical protein